MSSFEKGVELNTLWWTMINAKYGLQKRLHQGEDALSVFCGHVNFLE